MQNSFIHNRRSSMMVSALMILAFHLWVCFTQGTTIETFVIAISYIGVDIFFFLSAYALGLKKVSNYKAYVVKRFKAVYPRFFLFALIATIYKGWSIERFLKIITFVELFTKGGGAFLWFLPAILIIYLLMPLYQKAYDKKGTVVPVLFIIIWLAASLLISNLTNYKVIFIFTNRLPIIIFAFHMAADKLFDKILSDSKKRLVFALILAVVGFGLLYFFGYQAKLTKPIRDLFYVVAIPASLAIILLCDYIPESKVVKLIGSATLELYAIQMTFGYNIINKILKLTNNNKLISNTLGLALIVLIAVVVAYVYNKATSLIKNKLKKA